MKTDVAVTSIQAYHTAPTGKRRKEVYAIIAANDGQLCNLDISDKTGLPINCVTPASNWLVKHGYVEVAEVRESRTGYKAKYWKLKTTAKEQNQDENGNPQLF